MYLDNFHAVFLASIACIWILFFIFQKEKCFFEEDASKSLFLYAAINNMVEIAVTFWGYGGNGLMKALLGKLIFRKMYIQTRNVRIRDDTRKELRDSER